MFEYHDENICEFMSTFADMHKGAIFLLKFNEFILSKFDKPAEII